MDEAATFLEKTQDSHWALLWQTALLTGLRKGELLGLPWGDFHPKDRTLTVARQVVGHGTTADVKTLHSVRVIQLDAWLASQLETARRTATAPWIFATSSGRPLSPRNVVATSTVRPSRPGYRSDGSMTYGTRTLAFCSRKARI